MSRSGAAPAPRARLASPACGALRARAFFTPPSPWSQRNPPATFNLGVDAMNRITLGTARAAVAAALAVCSLPLSPPVARAQDDAGPPPVGDTTQPTQTDRYANLYQGQFTPGQGFDIIRSARGTLNISVYGVFRYLNQLPADQTFTDHLGRVRTVKTRNDLNWHRTMAWFTGWFYDPRFR